MGLKKPSVTKEYVDEQVGVLTEFINTEVLPKLGISKCVGFTNMTIDENQSKPNLVDTNLTIE